jgi:hypothetical protein
VPTDWTTISSLATAGGTLILGVATPIRNVGNGMAIIDGWEPFAGQKKATDAWGALEDFRRQTRALWVAPGDVAFWQGALRDDTDALQKEISSGVADGALPVDLLYLDHEGGQRTVSRFSLIRQKNDEVLGEDEGRPGEHWWVSLSLHHDIEAG